MTIRFPSGGAGVLSLTADILGTPLPQELTFFARFVPRGTSISGNVSIMSAGRWAAGSEFSMLTIGGTVLRAACRDGTNSQSAAATVALVAETEYKAIVSGSFGTSVTSKRAKLNGGTVATDATYVNMVLPGDFDRFRIGNRGFDSSLPFEGDLIEVAVWTTALSSTDEDLLAAGTSPASVSSGTLFDYWTFPSVAATYTGANGNVLTATGITSADTTAPTLSAASGTGGTLTCSGSVTTNEANGTLYAVVTGSATAPTAAQVKLGQDSTGTAALRVISQAVSATGVQTIVSGGVTAGTRYMHYMHEDAAANQSSVSSSASFTVTAGGSITFSSEPLKDNTGTILASLALTHYTLYDNTTGALVVRKTGLSTDASGIVSFTDGVLVSGTSYKSDWLTTAGHYRMPTKAAV